MVRPTCRAELTTTDKWIIIHCLKARQLFSSMPHHALKLRMARGEREREKRERERWIFRDFLIR